MQLSVFSLNWRGRQVPALPWTLDSSCAGWGRQVPALGWLSCSNDRVAVRSASLLLSSGTLCVVSECCIISLLTASYCPACWVVWQVPSTTGRLRAVERVEMMAAIWLDICVCWVAIFMFIILTTSVSAGAVVKEQRPTERTWPTYNPDWLEVDHVTHYWRTGSESREHRHVCLYKLDRCTITVSEFIFKSIIDPDETYLDKLMV